MRSWPSCHKGSRSPPEVAFEDEARPSTQKAATYPATHTNRKAKD